MINIELKKFPIPWRASNAIKQKIEKGDPNDVLFTHYIKESGKPIMSYSQKFIDEHGEEGTKKLCLENWYKWGYKD